MFLGICFLCAVFILSVRDKIRKDVPPVSECNHCNGVLQFIAVCMAIIVLSLCFGCNAQGTNTNEIVSQPAPTTSFAEKKCTPMVQGDEQAILVKMGFDSCMSSMKLNRPHYPRPRAFCACTAQVSFVKMMQYKCEEDLKDHLADVALTQHEVNVCLSK